MKDYQKIFIELAIECEALKFGQFTLKSGRQSPYFFNVGQLSSAKALHILGKCYAMAIQDHKLNFDTLFGPAYKGIPIASATAIMLNVLYDINCQCAFDRKETKDHGEGGKIIGDLCGDTLILDDVITKGTAIRHALNIIAEAGGNPIGIMVALDRQERGQNESKKDSAIDEIAKTFQIPVFTIINFEDIQNYVMKSSKLKNFSDQLFAYREKYGATAYSNS